MFLHYLLQFHLDDFLKILAAQDILGYYSIKIDFLKLFEIYPDIGDKVLCSPIKTLPDCDKDIVKSQEIILEKDEYRTEISKLTYCFIKQNVHARFFGLPCCPELNRTIFPKSMDLGCFLKLTGTVVRATQAKMLEYKRKYMCAKCKYENLVEADFENRYILKAPSKCGNTDMRCKCSTFNQESLVSREHCKDYQEIKVQEQVNKLTIGTIPGSMWVVFEDDLVDSCKPGDDVIICGTVRRRWRPCSQNRKSEVELVLQANYVEVCNAQRSKVIAMSPDIKEEFDEFWKKYEHCPLKGRDQILATVCPQVYGLHLVKLAVLLTVITGSNHVIDSDEERRMTNDEKHTSHVRGQCHLLLVGDPGTGKSQLLRAAADLTPRSVFTSGAGSTKAGLTCAALREDGEWQLEAGALVLSDGGVCCIDEISHLRDHDRTAIHEAMEQQTISVAKAGIVCKLNSRCAVIAACNPKGHYQTDEPLSSNVSLGTPLLSRFDLIFILLDSKNKSWDKLVSTYILFGGHETMQSKNKWDIKKLQTYIGLIGPRSIKITNSANVILQSYYMTQRKSEYRDASRTTVRMLDSLIRLSQAHCQLMYRTTILPIDAIVAVSLVDLSMQDCTLEDTVSALHSTFQKYPDFDYLVTAKKLLLKLNLQSIWQEELLYYAKLIKVDRVTLETEISNGSYHSFMKYDVVDDNTVILPASLVTSSYFNQNNNKNDTEKRDADKENSNARNERLAATLKKHASLNKKELVPQEKKQKRSRKSVQIDSELLDNRIKRRRKESIISNNINIKHSEVDVDINNMLNAVPSVNDMYNNLEISFNFNESDEEIDVKPNIELININKDNPKLCHNDNKDIENTNSKQNVNKEKSNISEDITFNSKIHFNKEKNETIKSDKIASKLKMFQFKEKHDLSKFYDEQTVVGSGINNENVTELKNIQNKSDSTSSASRVIQNSQLSMFETSDCDIDLEI